jgi:serine/threonine protein kinase
MIKELSHYNFIEYDDLNIDELLDKGNAEVFKGKYLEKDVAIKKYKNDENNINESIFNELKIGSKIKSERLMKTYGYSYDEKKEYIYLIMEYINSKDLWYYINSYYDDDNVYNKMSKSTKISVIKSLLKAIKEMWNEDIVHGDLKPLNLAIHRRNDEIFIKIIDYGTCEIDYRNNGIDKEYVCSTNGYISPELNETFIISHKSDIYALGVIILEIWRGIIDSEDRYKTSRNILLKELRYLKNDNPELEKIIRKCVDIKPDNRPDIFKLIKMFDKLS